MPNYSICSYSFHRSYAAGKMDVFQFIDWNQQHGFTQLDPWMEHLRDGYNDDGWLQRVKDAAAAAGLPFGCIAVDGAHIYEPTEEGRAANRARAYRWINIAAFLGAPQVRIDCGGPEEMPDDVFAIVVEGYHDIIAYAKERGVEIIMENHWGPSKHAHNVVKIMEALPELGLLFDTNNWAEGTQEDAWEACAKYARLTHMKTFSFDENGNEATWDIPKAMRLLQEAGYAGTWGIESVPVDGDESAGALKTLALMKRVLGDAQ